jgi:Flp pilus assembly pilin Flp
VVETVRTYLWRFLSSEAGQDLVEYALVTMFVSVAVVIAAAATGMVPAFTEWGNNIGNCLSSGDPLSC